MSRMRNVLFLHIDKFSSGHGSFFVLSGAEHAGGAHVRFGASLGPGRARWRIIWAFKVARTGSFEGARSATPSLSGPWKPRNLIFSQMLLSHRSSSPQALYLWQPRYSSRTSSSSLCDGHGRCFCVCNVSCRAIRNKNEDIISYEGANQLDAAQGGQDDKNISSEFQRQPCSHGTH